LTELLGFCERFNRTVKEGLFSVAFRKTLYASVDQLQNDLDRYLDFYNRQSAHRGYRTQGRTPLQAFLDGKAAVDDGSKKEVTSAA
jgi:Integrase core domain